MNPYELILLFDPGAAEEKISQFVTKLEDKIRSAGGEVDKTEKWGIKKLASMIKKMKSLTQAYYVLIRFKSPPTVPAELTAHLKVSEIVVRYFISCAVPVEAAAPAPSSEVVAVGEIKGEPLAKPE